MVSRNSLNANPDDQEQCVIKHTVVDGSGFIAEQMQESLGMFKAFFENALLSRSTIDECGNNFKVKKKWYRMQLKFFHNIKGLRPGQLLKGVVIITYPC